MKENKTDKELLDEVAEAFTVGRLVFEPQLGGNCTANAIYDLPDGKFILITSENSCRAPESCERFFLGIYEGDGAYYGEELAMFESAPYVWVEPGSNPEAHKHMQMVVRRMRRLVYNEGLS